MSGLFDLLSESLSGNLGDISKQLGTDPGATEKGIEMAVPVLVGALANNANRSVDGAAALSRALDRDHGDDLLGQLGGLLSGGSGSGLLGSLLGGGGGGGSRGGGLGSLLGAAAGALGGGASPKSLDGAGILGHVLGSRQRGVETGISRASGLQGAQVSKLLMLIAPLVMNALAKQKRQAGLDERGLAGLLQRERDTMEANTPKMKRGGLAALLDRDDDGSIADDLAQLGATLGGPLFGGSR